MSEISGEVAPGFEDVRDAFEKNFEEGREVGAAFSAYHRGEKVVDLWGGIADEASGRPWDEDTIALVFSTTKGITAMCANHLVQEGRLDVDATVATYWPEFAQNAKQDITVAQLLSHQAGLAWVDEKLTLEEALAWDPVIASIERQGPAWAPGEQHGYHATMYGWLAGELVRRISGVDVGSYLRDNIAGPLGADFWIGLPEQEEPRVASLISFIPPGIDMTMLTDPGDNPVAQLMAQFIGPDTKLGKALGAPGGAFTDIEVMNTRAVRAAVLPAFNGVGSAEALARLYAACVSEVEGQRVLSDEQTRIATIQRSHGPDTVLLDLDVQFGLGFMVFSSLMGFGGPASFGHFGMGGSMGWADPDIELAMGYVMNRMDIGTTGDPRSYRLVNACYKAIA